MASDPDNVSDITSNASIIDEGDQFILFYTVLKTESYLMKRSLNQIQTMSKT